jgi:transposase
VVWATPAQQLVCQAYLRPVHAQTARRPRLEHARHEPAQAWRLHPVVEALQAWRGVQCTGAVTLVAALGDLSRCDTPSELLQCVGLVPAAYSTGARRRQGGITTAGTRHARRVLLEGAWVDRYPTPVSRHRHRRLAQPPKAIQDSSGTAQGRLCQRYHRVIAREKHANPVVVAMARERLGCRWAMATPIPGSPSGDQTAAA